MLRWTDHLKDESVLTCDAYFNLSCEPRGSQLQGPARGRMGLGDRSHYTLVLTGRKGVSHAVRSEREQWRWQEWEGERLWGIWSFIHWVCSGVTGNTAVTRMQNSSTCRLESVHGRTGGFTTLQHRHKSWNKLHDGQSFTLEKARTLHSLNEVWLYSKVINSEITKSNERLI